MSFRKDLSNHNLTAFNFIILLTIDNELLNCKKFLLFENPRKNISIQKQTRKN